MIQKCDLSGHAAYISASWAGRKYFKVSIKEEEDCGFPKILFSDWGHNESF
jgi:hypothetical protein